MCTSPVSTRHAATSIASSERGGLRLRRGQLREADTRGRLSRSCGMSVTPFNVTVALRKAIASRRRARPVDLHRRPESRVDRRTRRSDQRLGRPTSVPIPGPKKASSTASSPPAGGTPALQGRCGLDQDHRDGRRSECRQERPESAVHRWRNWRPSSIRPPTTASGSRPMRTAPKA